MGGRVTGERTDGQQTRGGRLKNVPSLADLFVGSGLSACPLNPTDLNSLGDVIFAEIELMVLDSVQHAHPHHEKTTAKKLIPVSTLSVHT